MEDKIKKALRVIALLETLMIKIISLVGWILILINVLRGKNLSLHEYIIRPPFKKYNEKTNF